MQASRAWHCALFAVIGLLTAAQVSGQAPREQAIAQWLAKTDWPNGKAALDIMYADLPREFLAGVGQRANLSSQWAPGNAHWEAAYRAVADAIRAEEGRTGPVIPRDAVSIAPLLARLRFTDDDIALLEKIVDTPYGRGTVAYLDHFMVADVCDRLLANADVQPEARRQLELLRTRIRDDAAGVLMRLGQLRESYKADAAWLDTVSRRAGLNEESGRALSREFLQRPLQRMMGVIARDAMSAVLEQVAAFRASEAGASAPSRATYALVSQPDGSGGP